MDLAAVPLIPPDYPLKDQLTERLCDVLLVSMLSPDEQRFQSLQETVAHLLQRQNKLEDRLAALEAQRAVTNTAAAQTERKEAAPKPVERRRVETPPPPPEPPPPEPLPPSEDVPLETAVGLTLINRIGVITLVLGVAFFFKWAVDNNWIGPAGRVMLGLLAGLATLWLGDFFWRKAQRTFAQGIAGAGIAVLYLSSYASFGLYHLVPQALAFLLMCAVTALAFALSLRYNSPAVTALGLLGGYLTPLVLSTGEDRPWFLFAYILLLDLAAMALAKKRNWRSLEIISAFATAFIYGGWLTGHSIAKNRAPAAIALYAFYALYSRLFEPLLLLGMQVLAALAIADIAQDLPGLFFPLALALALAGLFLAEQLSFPYLLSAAFGGFWLSYIVDSPWTGASPSLPTLFLGITAAFLLFFCSIVWLLTGRRQEPNPQNMAVVGLNGLVYYAAAYALLAKDHHAWLGLLAVAVAGAYLAFAAFLLRKQRASPENRPVLLSLGMALAFATLAIPIQFTSFTITVAWAIEAALLSWIAWRFRNLRAVAGAALVFASVAVRLLFIDSWMLPDARLYSLFWNARFFTFAVVAVSLFLAARWTFHLARGVPRAVARGVVGVVALWQYFGAHVVLLWALSWEIAGWAQRSIPPANLLSAETFSLSILYAVYALGLVGAGVATRSAVNRIAGLILIGIVIAKLYLFDIWQLERPYRISAFIALGVLLLSTSFLYSRFRPLIESLLKDEEASS